MLLEGAVACVVDLVTVKQRFSPATEPAHVHVA